MKSKKPFCPHFNVTTGVTFLLLLLLIGPESGPAQMFPADTSRILKDARITYQARTRIPQKIVNMNVVPTLLSQRRETLTKQNVEPVLKSFLGENTRIFSVKSDDLKILSAEQRRGKWYVKFQQMYQGIPVYQSNVSFIATDEGRIQTYGSSYRPDITVSTTPRLSVKDAADAARKTYDLKTVPSLLDREGELIIFPEETEIAGYLPLAWKFLVFTENRDPEVEKIFIVDALTGQVLKSWQARFPRASAEGQVRGEIYPLNPTTPAISTEPLAHSYVDLQNIATVTTNLGGHFSQSLPWWWNIIRFYQATFRLEGPYARVRNNNGNNYTVSQMCNINSACDHTWTAADRDHINVFYHMNLMHDWYVDRLNYQWVNAWDNSSQFHAEVNWNFNNAYAGDPMQYGTNNWARSSDIIYHECTHNVLYHIFGDYVGWPDAYEERYGFDEGFADYYAAALTEDPAIGEGAGMTRTLDNTNQYTDKATYNIEGHTGGTIIAGASWDLRESLMARMGDVAGSEFADNLFFDALFHMATLPRDYYFSDPQESNFLTSLYIADDDNNNLLDGVPHFYLIQTAFANHNLLQAELLAKNSYDVSTNTVGNLTGGDFYFSQGSFWANNVGQRGVLDLGNIGAVSLDDVTIPFTGYTRFGVTAVLNHTYVALAQQGEEGNYIVFRVTDLPAANDRVVIEYRYRAPLRIDPFDICKKFPAICGVIYPCDKYPFLCQPRIIIPEKDIIEVEFLHEFDQIVLPLDKICQYVLDCPGCGPDQLCPGYEFAFQEMPFESLVEVYNSNGEPVVKDPGMMRSKKIEFRTQQNQKYFLVISPKKQLKKGSKFRIPFMAKKMLK